MKIVNSYLKKSIKCLAKFVMAPLYILSFFYGGIIFFLRFLKSRRLFTFPCRVISVGNITVGGTGKTPLVEYLVEILKEKGFYTAVLSRGYSLGQNLTDEPDMLREKLDIPVIIDKNRIRGINRALKEYKIDTVILDDGFQQWQIAKNLEIVALDAGNPLGNGWILPAGILREPVSSLKRAQVVVLTKTNFNPDTTEVKKIIKRINPAISIFDAEYQPQEFYRLKDPAFKITTPQFFKNRKVVLVCAIANPESFNQIILSLGIKIENTFKFPDHHLYTPKDIEKIKGYCKKKGIELLITTEKDAVKLKKMGIWTENFFVLKIKLNIINEKEFKQRLFSIYNS